MKPTYWLVIGIAAVGTVQVAACSSSSHSCEETRTCGTTEAGAAGQGAVGSPAAGAGGADADSDGDSGAAGAAAPITAVLFGACSKSGLVACERNASVERLACDGTKWQMGTACSPGQLCDSRDGSCAKPVADCADATPGAKFCQGDTVFVCGSDLVTSSQGDMCTGLCDSGECQAPVCGDKKVEAGEDCDEESAKCIKCKKPACGDGVVQAGVEECDDGNTVGGDGCSPSCSWEPVSIALGRYLSCALSANGLVKCWGNNASGSLGLGDMENRGDQPNEVGVQLKAIALGTGRTAKAIAAAERSVCAVLDNGSLKCWGANDFGQLGTTDIQSRGGVPGQMGDALKAIPFNSGEIVSNVTESGSSTCATLNNGTVKCWGAVGDTTPHLVPTTALYLGGTLAKYANSGADFTCVLCEDATERCPTGSPTANIGAAPLTFGLDRTVRAISNGLSFGCTLLDNATVKCWGKNNEGEVGQGDALAHGTTLADLAALAPIDFGSGRTVAAISAGLYHACALLDNGDVKCWGSNGFGELGQGDNQQHGSKPGQMGDALLRIDLGHGRTARSIAAGAFHSCAILDNGTLKCWGSNTSGELGQGDTTNRGDKPGQMGDALKTIDLAF